MYCGCCHTCALFSFSNLLFARKYKAVTQFGDYYDHISDGIKISGLLESI